MRFWLLIGLLAGLPAHGLLAADIPPLLRQALIDASRGADTWAYTETSITKGIEKSGRKEPDKVTIVRFDPSKPYAEQFTPIQIEGRPPTKRDLKRFREQGEKRGKRLEPASSAPAPADAVSVDHTNSQTLAESLDVDRITVLSETDRVVTYDVPLRKNAELEGFPVGKFHLTVRVNKERRALEALTFHTDKARIFLVLNITSADVSVEFATIDPKYTPAMARTVVAGSYSLFGFKKQLRIEVTHTEVKHVTPFGNRLDVRIGPLRLVP